MLSYVTTHQADVNYNNELEEKVKTLVEALEDSKRRLLLYETSTFTIDAALAKVK